MKDHVYISDHFQNTYMLSLEQWLLSI